MNNGPTPNQPAQQQGSRMQNLLQYLSDHAEQFDKNSKQFHKISKAVKKVARVTEMPVDAIKSGLGLKTR